MTSIPAQSISADTIDENALGQYLQQTPDFFERHPQLLTRQLVPTQLRPTQQLRLLRIQLLPLLLIQLPLRLPTPQKGPLLQGLG